MDLLHSSLFCSFILYGVFIFPLMIWICCLHFEIMWSHSIVYTGWELSCEPRLSLMSLSSLLSFLSAEITAMSYSTQHCGSIVFFICTSLPLLFQLCIVFSIQIFQFSLFYSIWLRLLWLFECFFHFQQKFGIVSGS